MILRVQKLKLGRLSNLMGLMYSDAIQATILLTQLNQVFDLFFSLDVDHHKAEMHQNF